MNDGPGVGARFALADLRMAPLDAAYRERIARELARENDPASIAEAVAKATHNRRKGRAGALNRWDRSMAKLAAVPHWPNWAPPPRHAKPGECPTCHGRVTATSTWGGCHICSKRLGRHLGRVALAWRLFRAGEWTP